ncbi:hypothetical protein [Pseudoalteromonas sp. MMG005]|uniref:hypothetical protein n=1 Tax=Pseudoalteromonas sp. MMG005 TaxID=2822682 RepID=UPI001B3A01F9|nr:hypothetical protein [Pseudoalteromonas sp. MMG005]
MSYQTITKNLPFEIDNKRLIYGIYHIQTLKNWMICWKQWLRQFNGVGTDYLYNYIAWLKLMYHTQGDDSWINLAL